MIKLTNQFEGTELWIRPERITAVIGVGERKSVAKSGAVWTRPAHTRVESESGAYWVEETVEQVLELCKGGNNK